MRRLCLPVVFFALLAGGCARGLRATQTDILMGPYVSDVSEQSATVHWVTGPGVPAGSVHLGEQGERRAQIQAVAQVRPIGDPPDRLHTAVLSGLRAGRTYRYSVVCGDDRVNGSFSTPPARGSREPLTFLVYGDTRTYPERHRAVIRAMKRELPAAFIINTGDLVSDGTVWPQWKVQFFDPARDILDRTVLWPARGNHEMDGLLYGALFGLSEGRFYYSFDWGDLHVVVLDSEVLPSEMPEMVAWLEKDLAAAQAEWTVVAYHTPTFNIGGHGSTWGREDVLPVLERHGVDIVCNGHSHLYERFRPIGPSGGKPIIHIVTGGGGAPVYPIRPSPILESSYSGLHFCVFTIEGDKLAMTVKTPGGEVLDRMTLVKTDGVYQDEVMRKAVDTDEAIELAFAIAGFAADFGEIPRPGVQTLAAVDTTRWPRGSTVRIGQSADSEWSVQPTEFEVGDEPVRINVTPPQDLAVSLEGFSPPLKVDLLVVSRGASYSSRDAPVWLGQDTVRRIVPEPEAVDVPLAPGPIAVDGDLDDWRDIRRVYRPSRGSASRTTRLAWRAEGLYAAVSVPDSSIEVSPSAPWQADCLELWLETDYARAVNASENPNALKCQLFPLPESGPGRAGVMWSYGRHTDNPGIVEAAWQRTERGYALEFLIPAEALQPARMQAGTKIGFHYVLHNAGRAVEQFASTAGKRRVWNSPFHWGALRFAENG